MNALTLAFASIISRPLQTLLCIAGTAAGIALLCFVLLVSKGLDDGISRNMRGIDIVVGAKGSPLQLILSTVFHADVPNGNIEAHDAEQLAKNPQVAKAIPIAVGDSYKGFRVVGTSADYISLFNGEFAQGRIFEKNFDAVIGANVGLPLGTKFAAVHGLSIESDDVHDAHLYEITGILKPTGTVLDRLIMTPVGSVQELHSHHEEHEHEDEHHHESAEEEAAEEALGHQVTAMLLKVRSTVAIMNLPRSLNKNSNILAVSPSYELARFSQTMGFSRDVFIYIGGGFLILSALTLLSSLSSSLALRRYDLGVLRSMGASPSMIRASVMGEGLIIGVVGAITGIIIGHLAAYGVAGSVESLKSLIIPGDLLKPQINDLYFVLLGGIFGLAGGIIPAFQAARTDVADLLSKGRI